MGTGSEPSFSLSLKMLDSAIRPAIIAFFVAHAPCPGGGIGRRTWFRSMRRKAWRFESSLGHQDSNSEQSEEVRKTPSILVITGFFVFFGPGCSSNFQHFAALRRRCNAPPDTSNPSRNGRFATVVGEVGEVIVNEMRVTTKPHLLSPQRDVTRSAPPIGSANPVLRRDPKNTGSRERPYRCRTP